MAKWLKYDREPGICLHFSANDGGGKEAVIQKSQKAPDTAATALRVLPLAQPNVVSVF